MRRGPEKQKERKERNRKESLSGDSHKHIYLLNPKNGKIEVFTKSDHVRKIENLVQRGWEIIQRPD